MPAAPRRSAAERDAHRSRGALDAIVPEDGRLVNEPIERAIVDLLSGGAAASLAGFGVFLRERFSGASARNPATGGVVRVEAKTRLQFVPDAALRGGPAGPDAGPGVGARQPTAPRVSSQPSTVVALEITLDEPRVPDAAPVVAVEARLAESLSISTEEARAALAPWIAEKVAFVLASDADCAAAVERGARRTPRRTVPLGGLGALEVQWVLIAPVQEQLLGRSHRRFVFRPSQSLCEALGADPA
jgi:nucleoid DNA-binding protein